MALAIAVLAIVVAIRSRPDRGPAVRKARPRAPAPQPKIAPKIKPTVRVHDDEREWKLEQEERKRGR